MEAVEPIRDRAAVIAIADYLWQWNPIYYLIFEFGVHTGLRVSDIRRLRFRDIIDEYSSGRRRWAREIRILEQKTRKKGKKKLDEEGQDLRKTNSKRIIQVEGQELEEVIRRTFKPITRWDLSAPLFPSRRLGPDGNVRSLGRWQIWHVIRTAASACDVPVRVGTHTLRKTFGYHYYKKTKDIAMLQEIFRHSSPEITLRYIGITQEDHAAAYGMVRFGTKKRRAFSRSA